MKLILLLLLFSGIVFAKTTSFKTNSLNLGERNSGDVYIYANTGAANLPFLFFDFAAGKWKQSNDGISSEIIGGAGATTTQGDLIIGDVSGDESRLAIGTTGKVLTSNGTTATWETPVEGSPTTTQNDLILRGATTDERLPVGTDTQILTVVSGNVAWAAAPSGGLPTMAKGSLVTSNGATNGEFTACADNETIVWDSTEANGFKCIVKSSFVKKDYSSNVKQIGTLAGGIASSTFAATSMGFTAVGTNPIKISLNAYASARSSTNLAYCYIRVTRDASIIGIIPGVKIKDNSIAGEQIAEAAFGSFYDYDVTDGVSYTYNFELRTRSGECTAYSDGSHRDDATTTKVITFMAQQL